MRIVDVVNTLVDGGYSGVFGGGGGLVGVLRSSPNSVFWRRFGLGEAWRLVVEAGSFLGGRTMVCGEGACMTPLGNTKLICPMAELVTASDCYHCSVV